MKKMRLVVVMMLVAMLGAGCAGVLDKTHTLNHPDGRTTECIMPGAGGLMGWALIWAEPIGNALYGKEFDECITKAKSQGFVDEVK